MKRSEVLEVLLDSYYRQEGKHADTKLTAKARKIIAYFKKEEEKLGGIINGK